MMWHVVPVVLNVFLTHHPGLLTSVSVKEMMDLRHAETRNMISASSFWYSTTCPHWRIQHEILGSKVWLKRAPKIEQQRNNASQIAKCKQSKCKMQLKLNHSHLTQDHITKSSEKCPLHFTAIISRTPRNTQVIQHASFIQCQPSNTPSLWIRLATDSMPAAGWNG